MLLDHKTDGYAKLSEQTFSRYARIVNPVLRTFAIEHTAMTVSFMTMTALRRNLDFESARIAALLHDAGKFDLNEGSARHAAAGALRAEELLSESGCFSQSQIDSICEAIRLHSSKDQIDSPLAEALKDADVLASWAVHPDDPLSQVRQKRLEKTCAELNISLQTPSAKK